MNPDNMVSDSYLREGWTAVRDSAYETSSLPGAQNIQLSIYNVAPHRKAIYDLGLKRLRIFQPLPVRITREGAEYKAEVPQLEIYAFGVTEKDVLAEVTEDVAELCQTLFYLSEKQMSSNVKTWKIYLQRYVTKNV